jgi:signal transduction histidine kinase
MGRYPTALGSRLWTTITARRLAASMVILSGLLSVVAAAIALVAAPSLDVAADPHRGQVRWVLPGGSSWGDGVRAGQRIVKLTYGTSAEDWDLLTSDALGTYSSPSLGHVAALRATWPAAVAAGLSALLGVLLLGRRRKLAAVAALVAIALAMQPIGLDGEPIASTFLMASTPLLAAIWLARISSWHRWSALVVVAAAVTAVWTAGRTFDPDLYPVADAVRVSFFWSLTAIALAWAGSWREWLASTRALDPALAIDAGAVVVILAVGGLAVFELHATPLVSYPVVALVLVAYLRLRRRVGVILERLVFGSMREHASIIATEEERARLASEIHDGPLQELAAVIGQLDDAESMSGAASVLRDVAAELRGVTTALRPPVLDDLGLGAAVAFLVDQARLRATCPVITCTVEDLSQVGRGDRPPPGVELAAFRVVQEALANALLHAHADHISVAGRISAANIELHVSDDGTGIAEVAARAARRRGRVGMSSMRQRSAAIGAELTFGRGTGEGASVSFAWSAT